MARPKLVVDECLSVELPEVAHARGFEAYHVAHRGLAGAKDRKLRAFLARTEAVLVTNNGEDFLKLYRHDELHPGLIILVPNLAFIGQCALFEAALDHVGDREGLINRVIEVHSPVDIQWPTTGEKRRRDRPV